MKPWSERIPAAIANAERMLDGGEYVLIPPHIGGNETKLTLVLTAGELALVKALWKRRDHVGPLSKEASGGNWVDGCECGYSHDFDFDCDSIAGTASEPPPSLIAFTGKIERLNHD